MRVLALATVLFAASAAGALAQDVAAGEQSFKKCIACHAVGEGAKNKVGPELNGLNGRKAGTAPDYSYTEANKNSGLTWDEATLTKYLQDPQGMVKGTKMIFPGIKDEQKVKDVIAYLKQYGPDGQKTTQ